MCNESKNCLCHVLFLGFGTGAMILDGFKISQIFENEHWMECYGPLNMLVAIVHIIFCFFQTFFLFKNHRVCKTPFPNFSRSETYHSALNICFINYM